MPGGRTKGVSMGSDGDVVLGVIKAVQERDGERLFELYHDDVELHEAPSLPYGGTVKGVPSLKEQLETAPEDTWLGTWGPVQPTEDERRFDPRVLSEKDGEVVVLYWMRGVAPDGERFESPLIGLYEVRDGKLFRAQMFHFDTQAINEFIQQAHEPSTSTAA
jgi:ketosteroid isomerase-like protein